MCSRKNLLKKVIFKKKKSADDKKFIEKDLSGSILIYYNSKILSE